MSDGSPKTAWEWRATGSTWRIHHCGGVTAPLATAVARSVERDEARWSRFRPQSEVSRINRGAGQPVHVSPDTLTLLEACNEWARRTDGVFNPLIGGVLVSWGYRRSLTDTPAYVETSPQPAPVRSGIRLDRRAATARIPRGTRLDLGGIAKTWMAARAAAVLRRSCEDTGVLVDAGGDLVAATGDHVIGVERAGPATLSSATGTPLSTHVRLFEGQGVATSGWGRRRWTNGDGSRAHHLIDPDTGSPGLEAHATVIADDPVAADVLAKVLCLRPERLPEIAEAAMLTVNGEVRTTSRWAEVQVGDAAVAARLVAG